MALRPIDFNVPQRRPSIIEEAFGAALATAAGKLISQPFEKAEERRRFEMEGKLGQQRVDLAVQQFTRQLDVTRAKEFEDPKLWLELTPDIQRQMQEAKQPVNAERGPNGKFYVPTGEALLASPAAMEGMEFVETIASRVLGTKQVPKPLDFPSTMTQTQFKESSPLLGEIVQGIGAAGQAERVGAQTEELRLGRLSNIVKDMYGPIDWGAVAGIGVPDPVTGELRPLNEQEAAGFFNFKAMAAFSNFLGPGQEAFAADLRGTAAAGRYAAENRAALPGMTTKYLTAALSEGALRETAAQLAPWAASLGKEGALWKLEDGSQKKITDFESEGPTHILTTEGLAEALLARRFYSDMNEYIAASKLPDMARLSHQGLVYLSYLYRIQGKPWKHPSVGESEIPPEYPLRTIQAAGAGQVSGARQETETMNRAATGEPGQSPGAAPLTLEEEAGTVPTVELTPSVTAPVKRGLVAPSYTVVGRSEAFKGLAGAFYTALKQNPGSYQSTYERMTSSFSSPDSAVAYLRRLNVPEFTFQDLLTGTERQRRAALVQWKQNIIGTLQTQRDEALRR